MLNIMLKSTRKEGMNAMHDGREGPGGRQIAAAQTYLFTTNDSYGNRKCAAFRDISSETCVIVMGFGGWLRCPFFPSPLHS